MADTEVTLLPEQTNPEPEDLMHTVDDVATTPTNKKMGFGTFLKTYNRTTAEIAASLSNDDLDFKEDAGNILRYGAVGDDSTDSTTAIQNAFNQAVEFGTHVVIPEGTFQSDTINYGVPSFARQFNIVGAGRRQSIIKKRTADGLSLLTVGNSSSANFIAKITLSDFELLGISGDTPASLIAFDIVRCIFRDMAFRSSNVALHCLGTCISNLVVGSIMDDSVTGTKWEFATSASGTGEANANTLQECLVLDNSEWGVDFNDGRMFRIKGGQIENNGKNELGPDFGGVRIRSASGTRHDVTKEDQTAAIIKDVWFEGNKGIADIWCENGFNVMDANYHHSNATLVTHDFQATGGRYSISNTFHLYAKTANINEGASVATGNLIENVDTVNITYNKIKTTLIDKSGANSMKGKLLIANAVSGATASTDQDNVVVDSSGRSGMTVLSGNTSEGRFVFGDDGSAFIGWLEYDHNTDRMNFRVNGVNRLTLTEDGGFGLVDAITAPATLSGFAQQYIDTADGDLKIKFGDGVVKTITNDTANQAYTESNVTTDRTYDANAAVTGTGIDVADAGPANVALLSDHDALVVVVQELADVVGTVIVDLRANGQVD